MFTGLESPVHLLILLIIILLFFGANRIPDLARSLGRGAREFREGIRGAVGDEKAEEKPSLEGAARSKILYAEEAETTRPTQKS
jgi:sec-independent protein translocase protein TatA